jgi:hypothetical protein
MIICFVGSGFLILCTSCKENIKINQVQQSVPAGHRFYTAGLHQSAKKKIELICLQSTLINLNEFGTIRYCC